MSTSSTSLRVEPNITPMIDVMLVLLIIFMIVTPLLANGFRAEAPKGLNLAAHPEEAGDVVIGIDANGRYYFNGVPMRAAELSAALERRFRGSEDRIAYVLADGSLDFSRIQDAIELARTSGVRVVGMIAERPRGKSGALPIEY